ncbi:hypothetical protein ACG7TL_006353 [Trametes sanguinea]
MMRKPCHPKVVIVMDELELDYRSFDLDYRKGEHLIPEHLKYNSNGRMPTLLDHRNGDFAVWESNAIIAYLVEKYDIKGKVSAKTFEGKMHQLQWVFFQASGQGPYYGQAEHCLLYHPEHVPSAVERYQKEVLRVLGVLDGVLSQREWLVADRCTIADLSFVPWNISALRFLLKDYPGFNFEKDFPSTYRWHTAMLKREVVRRINAGWLLRAVPELASALRHFP